MPYMDLMGEGKSLTKPSHFFGVAVFLEKRGPPARHVPHDGIKPLNLGKLYVPWSKLPMLGMVIPPLIGNPYNGYINPYYWVDDHPLLYGNNGSLDPGTYRF